jgi:hypothetical protein
VSKQTERAMVIACYVIGIVFVAYLALTQTTKVVLP